MRPALTASLLVLAIAAGCGGSDDETTIRTPGGTMKVKSNGDDYEAVTRTPDGEVVTKVKDGDVTITSDKGTFKMDTKGQLSEMGVDPYPGSRLAPDTKVTTFESGGAKQMTATLVSEDTLEKIVAYYKGKIGDKAVAMTSSDEATVIGETAEGVTVSAIVSKHDDGGWEITVTTMRKP